jgi:signal transduction histidine kinase
MGLRRRSIRLRIFLLILIPLLSLIGLYIFVASITVGDAVTEQQATQLKNDTGLPVGSYETQIEVERRLAITYLAAPVQASLAAFDAQAARTEQARSAMRAALMSKSTMGDASTPEKQAINGLLSDAASLAALRSRISARTVGRPEAMNAYETVVDSCENLINQVILREQNATLVVQGLALVRMGQAENVLLEEDALLEGDMAAQSFSAADRHQFAELVGARRALLTNASPNLNANDRYFYAKDINPQISAALTSLEDTIVADNHTSGPPPVEPASWGTDVAAVSQGFSQAGVQAANDLTQRAQPVARDIYLRLYLAGGLGLVAVILSIIMSVIIGRGLVRQLAELRRSALALAGERLPSIMARLRAGDDVDVSAEAPLMKPSPDEIGQVSQAFNTVQRTAIEAAVGQARLRQGVSDVFRNLARRSQSLLHRQLNLLDTMERRTGDPDELADLYRLDHLTTRMRRHAEGLIILSGAAPGRAWRNPVRLVDVLRAAVAEVEDYTRVSVATMTQAALTGPVVADVIHMIAELVENATLFSPPNTPVRLTGDIVGKGFAVEIEDRGLGVSEEKLAEINHRLATPPEFDLSDSDQLGLFVAGRLAARHGIKISMRSNPYGGTTAIVLIPRELVVPEEVYEQDTSAVLAGASAVQPTGRHAARSEDIIAAGSPTGSHPYANATDITGDGPPGADLARAGLADTSLTGTELANGGLTSTGRGGRGNGFDAPTPPDGTEAAPGLTEGTPVVAGSADAAAGTTAEATSWFERSTNHNGPAHPGAWPRTSAPISADSTPTVAAGLTDLGLPRRIRQANLAPQLRDTAPQTDIAVDDDPAEDRTPEQARAVMTAIQRGWQRGRSAADSSSAAGESEPGQAAVGEPAVGEPMASESAVIAPADSAPADSAPADSAPADNGSGGEEWHGDGSQE